MKKITIAANWKMYLDEVGSIDFINKLNAEKELFSSHDIIIFLIKSISVSDDLLPMEALSIDLSKPDL